ncbi:MAG: MBL fold metallo-hydrolase, partial [Candidatus Altiarchaeales archaeon HGW-Altiarchaeales-2]
MKVIPVCSESLGVRSLAVFVETPDVKIFIDPGAALGIRYGLEPSEEEWNQLSHFKEKIRKIANNCDILTISHYHYDHYDPDENFYEGKKVFAKDIKSNINKSQHTRGTDFRKIFESKFDKGELIYCDNQNYEFGNTIIKFSKPFPHGESGTKLGFVLMTTIEEKSKDGNFKILHTSDTGGAVDTGSR